MHTVAVLKNWEAEIEPIPTLLPGLKRLWFVAIEEAYNSKQTLAKRQSKHVKAFSQIECHNLIGVTVNYVLTFPDGEDEWHGKTSGACTLAQAVAVDEGVVGIC